MTISELLLTQPKHVFKGILWSLVLLTACTTTPTSRVQLKLFPSSQIAQMGEAAYLQIKRETPISPDPALTRYVQCITEEITAVIPPAKEVDEWQVTVFEGEQKVNAFALPGGKIGVYTGLIRVTENPSQLAAVIGHEIAHVTAEHGNARVSTQFATRAGLTLIQILTGAPTSPTGQQLMALLGLGAQVGIILPFSRAQERESDILGMEYMARAGFDPRQSLALWQNMMEMETEAPKPPELLSTHPSDTARIRHLKQHLSQAMALYQEALAEGRQPECRLVSEKF